MSNFKVGDRVRITEHAYASLGYHRGKLASVTEHRPAPSPALVDVWMVLVDGTLGALAGTAIEIEPAVVVDWQAIAEQHARQRDEAMAQRDRAQSNADGLARLIRGANDRRDYWRSERDGYARLYGEANSQIEKLTEQRDEATADRDCAEGNRRDLIAIGERLTAERDEARELLEVAKAQVTSEAQRASILTTACSDAMAQASRLRVELESMQDSRDYWKRRVEVMEAEPVLTVEQRLGRLEGIQTAREEAQARFRARRT